MIDRGYFLEAFSYHPDGYLVRKERPLHHFKSERAKTIADHFSGKRVGYEIKPIGYKRFIFCGKLFYEHRIIFILVNGQVLDGYDVDHINGNKSDNRIENLRLALRSENLHNSKMRHDNKCGAKGIHITKTGSFRAQVMLNGVNHRMSFRDLHSAEKWLAEKRVALHKQFANNGK